MFLQDIYILLISLVALLPLVGADLYIYYGAQINIDFGQTSSTDAIVLFNEVPSCKTPNSGWLYNSRNDINHHGDGFACDGCASREGIKYMPITRFELLDEDAYPLAYLILDDITLYQVEKEPQRFDIHWKKPDGSHCDGHDMGFCMRTLPEDADVWGPCEGLFSHGQAVQIFHCYTPMVIGEHCADCS